MTCACKNVELVWMGNFKPPKHNSGFLNLYVFIVYSAFGKVRCFVSIFTLPYQRYFKGQGWIVLTAAVGRALFCPSRWATAVTGH